MQSINDRLGQVCSLMVGDSTLPIAGADFEPIDDGWIADVLDLVEAQGREMKKWKEERETSDDDSVDRSNQINRMGMGNGPGPNQLGNGGMRIK